MQLVHKNEKPLFVISLVIGSLVWIAAVAGTLGLILIYVVLGLLFYLFAQSGFIAHIRGNAVELGEDQFPDLYRQYRDCCATLGMETVPRAYLLMREGVLNALAAQRQCAARRQDDRGGRLSSGGRNHRLELHRRHGRAQVPALCLPGSEMMER